jgi:site-specific DNA-cytosine methylase
MTRRVLDLFAGLGGFSAAFQDADGWEVTTVEIDESHEPDIVDDVMNLRPSDFDTDFDLVLASPPCTYFTTVRNLTKGGDDAWEDGKPAKPESRDHLALVYHTVGLIRGLSPDYWFMENPRGMLRKRYRPPEGTIWYCQYESEHAKPTDLWGKHPRSFEYRTCHFGNEECHHQKTDTYTNEEGETVGGSTNRQGILTETDSSERSVVPYGVSKAILDAVDEPESEQASVEDFY